MGIGCNFNLNLKRIGGDPKFLIWIVIVIGGIIAGVFTYFNLPARIEALEKDIPKCQDAVKELANTVDTYIKVQASKEEDRDKMEGLILGWIAELREAKRIFKE